jgi:hypothetical protein
MIRKVTGIARKNIETRRYPIIVLSSIFLLHVIAARGRRTLPSPDGLTLLLERGVYHWTLGLEALAFGPIVGVRGIQYLCQAKGQPPGVPKCIAVNLLLAEWDLPEEKRMDHREMLKNFYLFTEAVMREDAECVMLNKGPSIVQRCVCLIIFSGVCKRIIASRHPC